MMPKPTKPSVGSLAASKKDSERNFSKFLPPTPTIKRKREDDDGRAQLARETVKRKRSKNTKVEEDGDLDLDLGLNLAIGKLDSRLLADYVAQRTKRFENNLSVVELDDMRIPGTNDIGPSSCAVITSIDAHEVYREGNL